MKDGIELIAVVMAAPTSKIRFKDAVTLLNYGFSVCSIYQDTEEPDIKHARVEAGVKDEGLAAFCDLFGLGHICFLKALVTQI